MKQQPHDDFPSLVKESERHPSDSTLLPFPPLEVFRRVLLRIPLFCSRLAHHAAWEIIDDTNLHGNGVNSGGMRHLTISQTVCRPTASGIRYLCIAYPAVLQFRVLARAPRALLAVHMTMRSRIDAITSFLDYPLFIDINHRPGRPWELERFGRRQCRIHYSSNGST